MILFKGQWDSSTLYYVLSLRASFIQIFQNFLQILCHFSFFIIIFYVIFFFFQHPYQVGNYLVLLLPKQRGKENHTKWYQCLCLGSGSLDEGFGGFFSSSYLALFSIFLEQAFIIFTMKMNC